jgi:hypothetical protein
MSQYVYLYRIPPMPPVSPEVARQRMERWQVWMKELEDGGHLASLGHPLEVAGGVVKGPSGAFTDGPYAETKDVVVGFTVIKAKDLDEAVRLARGCPMLEGAGMVEVRPVARF